MRCSEFVFLVWAFVSILPWNALAVSPQFQRFDRNQDGIVTRDEFPSPLFDRIDANGDGVIGQEEDRQYLERGGRRARLGETTPVAENVRAVFDVPYAETDHARQRLDLYLPKDASPDKPLPVVTFIHGGAWRTGDKRGGYRHVNSLVESGEYAVASIGYRLSGEVVWPAQIHDCKAAIRWLKAHANEYHLDPERIGVMGTSAGGHLAAMLGTTSHRHELEGELGPYRDYVGSVACVVDQFGPTDLLSMGGRHDDPHSPESRLIGGAVQEKQDLAREASPTRYVSNATPPFMLLHGTEDRAVPFRQSELLATALRQAGHQPLLIPVVGAGHGNFVSAEATLRIRRFFDKHLRGQQSPISTEPIQHKP